MADCSVADVLTNAMSILGDSFGEVTQEIQNDFQTAYGDLMACLIKLNSQEVQREVYYTLPANTNVVFPSSLGVTDFAEPQQVWERGNVQSLAVASTTDGTPITVTLSAPGTPGQTGARVELNGIQGVPGYVNRDWFITVLNSTQFTLNGSVACGSNGTGGSCMTSVSGWLPMANMDVTPLGAAIAAQGNILGSWRWTDNAIYVPGALEDRQLWIEYLADETAPVSGVIGLCDGRELNFLSYATAARFAPKRQLVMGPYCQQTAYGPTGEPDGSGGMLRQLLIPIWKQRQQLPREQGRYRRRRSFIPVTSSQG